MAKPTSYLGWVPGGGSAVALPPLDQCLAGWSAGEPVPAPYANWLFYTLDQWIQWIDQKGHVLRTQASTPYNRRLLASGTWSYDDSTGTFSWPAFSIAYPGMPDNTFSATASSAVLSDGTCLYMVFPPPTLFTATSTSGSNQLTNVFPIATIAGTSITGPGISAGTTVSSYGTTTLTLSANATSSNPNATYVTYQSGFAVIGGPSPWDTFNPSSSQVIVARRVGSAVHVGINATQIVLRNNESKYLLEEGYTSVISGTAGQNISKGQAVYLSTGSAAGDTGRTAGQLYLCDTSAVALSQYRSVCAGVSTATISTGAPLTVATSGFADPVFANALGTIAYVDPASPGNYTTTKPSTAGQYVVPMGQRVASNRFVVSQSRQSMSTPIASPTLIRVPLQTLGLANPTPNQTGVLLVYAPGLNVPWEYRMLTAGTYSLAAFYCMASGITIGATGSVSSTLYKNGVAVSGSSLSLQSSNQKPSVTWAAGAATFSGGLIDSLGIQYVINTTTWTGGPGGITWQVWIYLNA